jgi:hypothetical protein
MKNRPVLKFSTGGDESNSRIQKPDNGGTGRPVGCCGGGTELRHRQVEPAGESDGGRTGGTFPDESTAEDRYWADAPPGNNPNWNPSPPLSPFGGLGLDPGIWNPFKEFRRMRQQMDQMFNESFGRFRQSPDFQSMWDGTTFAPSMDVEEQDEAFVIRMDIPGAENG